MFNINIFSLIILSTISIVFSKGDREYNTVFQEDFDNNNNNWPKSEVLYVKDGMYMMDLNEDGRRPTIQKKYNNQGNFVIEAAFYSTNTKKGKDTNKVNQYGIVWGAESDDPNSNSLGFTVTNDGYFTFNKKENGEYIKLGGEWIESDWINQEQGSKNLLQVYKIDDNYSFHINTHLVSNHELVSSYGDYVGVYGSSHGSHKIKIDHLYIWEFENRIPDVVENQDDIHTEHQQTQQTSDKKQLFFDNFNNTNSIYYDKDDGKVTMSDGAYKIMRDNPWDHNSSSGTWSLGQHIETSFEDIDFEIATSVTHINREGDDRSGYGIFWGGSYNGRENGSYNFYISQYGHYKFDKYFTNHDVTYVDSKDFIPWTVSEHVKTDGSPNKIVIQKKDNMYLFYINDAFIAQAPYERLIYGDNFGFKNVVKSKDHIEFDYISISQLGSSNKETIEDTFGEYHALLIPINNYQHQLDLRGPIPEIKKLKNILLDYNFKEENIVMLPNATTNQIHDELDNLESKLKPTDNLLIVYSGHGGIDSKKDKTFWCPSDSKKYRDFITDDDIAAYLRSFQSNNVLILADACFSGGILRHKGNGSIPRAPKELHKIKSRRVLSAADNTYSPDPSLFMKYIIKTLEQNSTSYLSSQALFHAIQEPILNNVGKNSSNPQWGAMRQAGDEGGDFIFIKK